MVTSLFQMVMTLHGWPVYAVAFALAFLEAAAFLGLALPGATVFVAGVLRCPWQHDLTSSMI